MPVLRNFRLIPAFTLQGPGKQKQQLDAGSAEATAELGLLGNTPGLRAELASWGIWAFKPPPWSVLGPLVPLAERGREGTGWRAAMEGGAAPGLGLSLLAQGRCGLGSPFLGLSFPKEVVQ